ncbi:MAG: DUF899 family protein [Maricaulaceae bacterium]|jgi:predicted dithiol-disulfide oxidoreductase (DUF899 family)
MIEWDNPELNALKDKLNSAQVELREALAEIASGEVEDYIFQTTDGEVKLSELFGGHRDLIVMHNMGAACPNCTMVTDGFNGLYPHVRDRAAFVISSPDPPEVQAALAAERGWRVPMISHAGSAFARDMGFVRENGGMRPGVSAFRKEDGKLLRVSATDFHAETDFCAIWRLLDLLPDGRAGWRPTFEYDAK